MSWPAILSLAGFVLLVLGFFCDYLVPTRHLGFGLRQSLAVALGTVFLCTGLLLRVDVLALFGLLLSAGGLSADLFGLDSNPGLGERQMAFIEVGLLLLLPAAIRVGKAAWRVFSRRRIGRARRGPRPHASGSNLYHAALENAI